uniref:dTDP-4-dehydrorhamnose 3,5-epimerase n=1 Tax=Rheinheimera sp. BAL341 TaxID=1708203 RepID=A0A486XXM1_9GAMM
MNIITTPLAGCVLIEQQRFSDERGFFQENFRVSDYAAAGISEPLLQDNWSCSVKGVLRGMHFQRHQPQGKLVTVLRGEIFDVAVDIRKDSATFGHWHGTILSEHSSKQLWLPPGFAHGFLVLSEVADVFYKTSRYYNPSDEGSFHWQDTTLAINWPGMPMFLSDKDAAAPPFETALC